MFCMFNIGKLVSSKCHGHGRGFRKEMTKFGLSIIFGIFDVDASRYADELWWFFCTCAVVSH